MLTKLRIHEDDQGKKGKDSDHDKKETDIADDQLDSGNGIIVFRAQSLHVELIFREFVDGLDRNLTVLIQIISGNDSGLSFLAFPSVSLRFPSGHGADFGPVFL